MLQVASVMDQFERQFEHLDVQTQTMEEAMSGVTTLTVPEVRNGGNSLVKLEGNELDHCPCDKEGGVTGVRERWGERVRVCVAVS